MPYYLHGSGRNRSRLTHFGSGAAAVGALRPRVRSAGGAGCGAVDLGVSRATVTGLVDGLEQEGLVARRPSAEDGRGAVVVLTARGAQRLRDMAPEHFARLEEMVDELTVDERAVFLDLLSRVVRGIGALTAE